MSYSFSGTIRYSEMDEHRSLSLYSLINYFQDCSNFHAEACKVGLDWTEANHRAWMLASWQILVDAYPTMEIRWRSALGHWFPGIYRIP